MTIKNFSRVTVTLQGDISCPGKAALTIQNSTSIVLNCNYHSIAYSLYGLEILSSSNITVDRCDITQTDNGILFKSTSLARAIDDSFFNNTLRGILLYKSDSFYLARDNFTYGLGGVDDFLSSNGVIENVSVGRTTYDGITIAGGLNNTVEYNTLVQNYGTSILLRNGPDFESRNLVASSNVIAGNYLEASLGPAIRLAGANYNTIAKNTVVGSKTGIDFAVGGAPIIEYSNVVTGNAIFSCGPQATEFQGSTFADNTVGDFRVGTTPKLLALPLGIPIEIRVGIQAINISTSDVTPTGATIKVANSSFLMEVGSSVNSGPLSIRLAQSYDAGYSTYPGSSNGTYVEIRTILTTTSTSTTSTYGSMTGPSGNSMTQLYAVVFVVAAIMIALVLTFAIRERIRKGR